MSLDNLESARLATGSAVLLKFGAALDKAQSIAASKTSDPAIRKLMTGRIALEYAVLATAREKNMDTATVANALGARTVAQQTELMKEGAAALGRAYGVQPDVLISAFAGKINDVEMPKGMGSTPEIDKMIDASRTLVTSVIKEEYAQRGRFEGVGRDVGYVALKSDAVVAPVKTELASRLAFMESSIDAAVEKGSITKLNADMLKERIEAQVFQPRPPQSLQFSKEFKAYFEQRGQAMRAEVMKDVRSVTRSTSVQDIAAKLLAQQATNGQHKRPAESRAQQAMER